MKKILFALVALLGIVACEEQLPKDPAQTLIITADKLSIEANGEDMSTFTVTNKEGNEVNATIRFYETQEALESNTFKTKYAGEYTFIAYSTNTNEVSNVITITATEPSEKPEPPVTGTLTLEVDKSEINADGADKVTFTAKWEGNIVDATIYNAENRTPIQGNTFSTTEAGEYKFYAKTTIEGYGEATSEEVKVTAKATEPEEEKPITIEATVDTIKANGIESTTFIVTQDGANVTSKCSIYANGSIVNGNKFATTTPGT
jgi:hypothetical protein